MPQKEVYPLPSLFLYLTEGIRSLMEWIASFRFRRKYQPAIKGDQHPVLIIPGFLGTDNNTKPMRKFLQRIGYTPYAWELGINLANIEDIDTLTLTLEKLFDKHQEKISIIGWSLGGIYARELSKRKPEIIRQVITTGSPFRGFGHPTRIDWMVRLLKGDLEKKIGQEFLETMAQPTSVLTTAIYSKKDGALSWQTCIEAKEDALHTNIEAVSSHIGMPHNQSVLTIIADRLPLGASKNKVSNQEPASISN